MCPRSEIVCGFSSWREKSRQNMIFILSNTCKQPVIIVTAQILEGGKCWQGKWGFDGFSQEGFESVNFVFVGKSVPCLGSVQQSWQNCGLEDDLQRFSCQPLRFQYLHGIKSLTTRTDDIIQSFNWECVRDSHSERFNFFHSDYTHRCWWRVNLWGGFRSWISKNDFHWFRLSR